MQGDTWEERRSWHLMRWLVYYLLEDFIPPNLARGATVLDFSAGLGDLGQYLLESGASHVVATRPEKAVPEPTNTMEWVGEVAADNIADRLEGRTFDLAAARMVFQFPTWEGDRADPDTMASQIAGVLRPGGLLVVAFHEFIPLGGLAPSESDPTAIARPGRDRERIVSYLGLPPREGPMGETGFGLKVPMLVASLVNHGYEIVDADHPEPFTYPLSIDGLSDEELADLGRVCMELKRRYLADLAADRYQWPGRVGEMLG